MHYFRTRTAVVWRDQRYSWYFVEFGVLFSMKWTRTVQSSDSNYVDSRFNLAASHSIRMPDRKIVQFVVAVYLRHTLRYTVQQSHWNTHECMCVQVFGVDFLHMNVIAIRNVGNFKMFTRFIQFMTNFISISNISVHSAFKSRALDYTYNTRNRCFWHAKLKRSTIIH